MGATVEWAAWAVNNYYYADNNPKVIVNTGFPDNFQSSSTSTEATQRDERLVMRGNATNLLSTYSTSCIQIPQLKSHPINWTADT